MKLRIMIAAMAVMLAFCCKKSPYVKGIVVGKKIISAHFEDQHPKITYESSVLDFVMLRGGFSGGGSHGFSSSSRSYGGSRSYSYSRSSSSRSSYSGRSFRSYRSISASRPSYVKAYTPRYNYTRTTYQIGMRSRSSIIYRSNSGRYYAPVMSYDYYPYYVHEYNYSSGTLLLTYLLLYRHMDRQDEPPVKYYLPKYQFCVRDSIKRTEWVDVDSVTYGKYRRGDAVNFHRFDTAEYEDECQED